MHSLLVLVGVLFNPKVDDKRVLNDWDREVLISELLLIVPILFLPTQNKSRVFLRLQSDAEIQLHYQRTFFILFTKLPPLLFLVSEVYGCVSSSESTKTCSVLSECNFAISIYLALSSVFYLYLNHAMSHYEAKDFLDFRGVDSYTLGSFIWEGLACALSYACFGLRPQGSDLDFLYTSSETALSERTGFEDGQDTVIRIVVGSFTSTILFGYSVSLILGFFSLRHAEVLTRASLGGGGFDADEVRASSTARCCIAFEGSAERVRKLFRVPENAIAVSGVYKTFLVAVIYMSPLLFIGGDVLVAFDSVDRRLWRLGVSFNAIGYV